MNDFLTVMGQLGVESILPETDLTLEQEMNEEISTEAELDEAYAGMEYSGIVAATSQAEAMLTAMAEREIGLESNAGADPCKIYQDFGLEAVKDVVMRKAYSTIASVKALINTCISWLKQLVGIEVASKKIFSGLERKAKAMDKSLRKVASKKMDEKLSRDMPDYTTVFTKLLSKTDGLDYQPNRNVDSKLGPTTYRKLSTFTAHNTSYTNADKAIDEKMEKINDIYDKNDTENFEGNACYSHILKAVSELKSTAASRKTSDKIKTVNDRIKDLEKLRRDVDKKDSSITANLDELSKEINLEIKVLTKLSNYRKKLLKIFVRVADDCLTMAKGVYAALV